MKQRLSQEGGGENIMLNPLYSRQDVAKRYRKSVNTINQWISRKYIPYRKIGKTVLFDVKELEQWEKGKRVTTNDKERQGNVL